MRWKCGVFASISNIKMAAQKFTHIVDKFFLMLADRTAVTIQANQIVLDEVRDN